MTNITNPNLWSGYRGGFLPTVKVHLDAFSPIHPGGRNMAKITNYYIISAILLILCFQPTRDATGAAIAVFTANKHFPSLTTHQTTLQVNLSLYFMYVST